jgi:RHS repeat-associated protein
VDVHKERHNTYTITNLLTGYKYTYSATTRKLDKIEDPFANAVTMLRDANWRLTKVTDANADDTTFLYNASGLCTLVTLPSGDSASFLYGVGGNLTKIVDPDSKSISFTYDSGAYMLCRKDDDGTESFAYVLPTDTSNEYKVTHADKVNNTIDVHWPASDDSNCLVEVTDGDGGKRSYKPGANGVGYEVSGASGQSINNATTTIHRDSYGYITRRRILTNPDTSTWEDMTFLRDANHNVTHYSGSPEVHYAYDTGDNTGAITRISSVGLVARVYYNSNNVMTRCNYPDGTNKQLFFNASGKITREIGRTGTTTLYEYRKGRLSRTTYADGSTTVSLWDNHGRVTHVTDVMGNVTQYEYAGRSPKNLLRITYPDQTSISYLRDKKFRITRETKQDGSAYTYSYDKSGNLLTKVNPLTGTCTYLYDKNRRVTRSVDEAGIATTTTYTKADSKITAATRLPSDKQITTVCTQYGSYLCQSQPGDGYTYNYTNDFYWDFWWNLTATETFIENQVDYDPKTRKFVVTPVEKRIHCPTQVGATTVTNGALESKWQAAGHGDVVNYRTKASGNSTKWEDYQNYGIFTLLMGTEDSLTKVTTADGATTYCRDAGGRVTRLTDPNGSVILSQYDSKGRLTVKTDAEGNSETYSYDPMDRVTCTTHADGSQSLAYYDTCGRITRATAPIIGDTVTSYDWAGRVTMATNPAGESTFTYYDQVGNIDRITDAAGHTTYYAYDSMSRRTMVQDPEGRIKRFWYDCKGNSTRVENPTGGHMAFMYSNMGQLTLAVDPNGNTATYYYCTPGYMTRMVLGSNRDVAMDYDQYGHLTRWREYTQSGTGPYTVFDHQKRLYYSQTDRLTMCEDYYEQGQWNGSQWISLGNPQHLVNARDTIYYYNAAGRITMTHYPSSLNALQYYDRTGRLTLQCDSANSEASYYDCVGNLTRKCVSYDGGTISKEIVYAYDALGRRTLMIAPDTTQTAYLYDSASRLSSLSEGGSLRAKFSYDLAGTLTRLDRGNGSYTNYQRDNTELPTLVNNAAADGTSISSFGYSYDPAGMVTRCDIGGATFAAASIAYGYDPACQLTSEIRTGGNSYNQFFWYDGAANRTRKSLNGTDTVYSYDYIGRMTQVGTSSVSWDYCGNMTKYDAHSYQWDDNDRLTKFDYSPGTERDTAYSYVPGTSRRYKRNQGGTIHYFICDGDNVVAEYDAQGALSVRYVTVGVDGIVSATRNGSIYYYMHDALGTIRNITDAAGAVQNTYDYYAFGDDLAYSERADNLYGFTGREFETGGINCTYYMRNRYYTSALGIFMSRDSMSADMFRGWGYAANNPLMFLDPFGRNWYTAVVGGLWGAATGAAMGAVLTLNPVGALAGAVGGAALGAYNGYQCSTENQAAVSGALSGVIAGPLAVEVTAVTVTTIAYAQTSLNSAQAEGTLVTGRLTIKFAPTEAPAALPEATSAGVDASAGSFVEEGAAADYTSIGSTGKVGEAELARLGGNANVYYSTEEGARFVDRQVATTLHESKVGYTCLDEEVSRQLEKDLLILAENPDLKYTWHFFDSPVTGEGGPSGPLQDLLDSATLDGALDWCYGLEESEAADSAASGAEASDPGAFDFCP